jgi:2-polyprenyl-6-methoxyphenol hydroxylase-like FAD-dependent oxidoreductase
MSITIGSGNILVVQRQGNGSYRIYIGLKVAEDFFRGAGAGGIDLTDLDSTRDVLLTKFFADWADEYKDLIRHSTDLRPWPLYTLSADDLGWKSVPGLTLAGDAAHLAVPNGEGVNQAMADALKLATAIEKHGMDNLDAAVREYEQEMFPRGIASIQEGLAMTGVMFGQEGPEAFLSLMSGLMAGGGQGEGA